MYNLDDNYNPKYKYSQRDLSRKIAVEYHKSSEEYHRQIVYRRLYSQDNGIIERLNKKLSYDIEKNAGDNPKYIFEKFQLLYCLYKLEAKENLPDEKKGDKITKRHSIINILSKPRMQNVKSVFSNSCVYGEIFYKLANDLAKVADPKSKQIGLMNGINITWQNMIRGINFAFSASDEVLKEREIYLVYLKKTKRFFDDILKLFKECNKNKELDDKFKCNIICYKMGVLETFLNILCVHHYLCYDLEVTRLKEPINIEVDKKYAKAFESIEFQMLGIESIPEIIDYLKHPKTHTKNSFFDLIVSLIITGLGVCEMDDIIFALERIGPVLKLIEEEKSVSFSKEIDITLFISVIQEIIYIHKNNVQIKADAVGFSTGKKALSKLLASNYEEQPSIVRIVWEWRISNRVSANFNLGAHISKAREIENTIYKIKKEVYSYINLDDINILTNMVTSLFKVYVKTKFDDEAAKVAIDEISKKLKQLQKNNG